MPAIFDLKKNKKDIKLGCSFIVGKSTKDNKMCVDKTMDCYMNKCRKELEDRAISYLSDEDIKKCSEESNGDYNKQITCHLNVLKKNNFDDKKAKMDHCTANKCPEMTKFIRDTMIKFGDRIYKSMPHNECVEKNCKKEYDDMDRIDSDKIKIGCNKKYEKYKDQLKCYGGMTKAFNKAFTKYRNCKDTKCKIDNKKNTKNTKNTHTKKSKKH